MELAEIAHIPDTVAAEWIACCRRRLPHETCGVLFGRFGGGTVAIDGFAVIRNAAAEPETSFRFAPDDWVRVWYDSLRQGREIVGVFHSHPDGSVNPSAVDLDVMPRWITCWIVGVTAAGTSRIAGYRHDASAGWRTLHLAGDTPTIA